MHGDIHQGKAACETTKFGWINGGVPLVQLNSKILLSSISLEGIKCYLCLNIVILSLFFIYFFASFIKLSRGLFIYANCYTHGYREEKGGGRGVEGDASFSPFEISTFTYVMKFKLGPVIRFQTK